MQTSQILQHLYSLDKSSPDLSRYLYHLIQSDGEDPYLLGLQGPELTRLVDFLDTTLSVIPAADDVSRQCLHKLQAICSHHGILPSSHIVSGGLTKLGDYPVASGGFADVWEGTHYNKEVCIKCPKITIRNRQVIEKAFYKEAIMWKWLKHQNIVSFIGVTQDPLQFVSEWMPNGTLTDYLGKNPDVNRVDLLLDVAEGLFYLHSKHTTHGDLKGLNILIDHRGRARLTDFGFASVVRGLNSVLVTSVQGFTAGWAAPEVLRGKCVSTTEADVYSFGIVVIEVFTGSYPFSDLAPGPAVYKMVVDHELPDRPQRLDLTDPVWNMTLRCWQHEPDRRPKMTEVVTTIRDCHRSFISAAQLPMDSEPPASSSSSHESLISATRPPTDSILHFPSTDHTSARQATPSPHASSKELAAPDFEDACRRIDEVAEELATGRHESRDGGTIELLKLCGYWCTVPTSYKLEGVVRNYAAQHVSQMTEIWKARYSGREVAVKIVRVRQGDPLAQRVKRGLYKEAVLIKEVKHDNILPFYGVSMDPELGCGLVFPWYENGNVMNYLKENPDVDRYILLSGAVRGLQFLHTNFIVHGALRPSHVLIDNGGNARLACGGHGSLMAVPGTPLAGYFQYSSKGNLGGNHYLAPEIQWPEDYGTDEVIVTKESDVFGMAMVIYEVLADVRPYRDFADASVSSGQIPERPSGRIGDTVWSLLKGCWNKVPARRPPLDDLHNALSDPGSRHRVIDTPQGRVIVGLPPILHLRFLSIAPSPTARVKRGQFYLKLKYGEENYTTPPTESAKDSDDKVWWWYKPQWKINTSVGDNRQSVFLEVFIRKNLLRKDVLWATGNFSLFNKGKEFVVRLEEPGTGVIYGDLQIRLESFSPLRAPLTDFRQLMGIPELP